MGESEPGERKKRPGSPDILVLRHVQTHGRNARYDGAKSPRLARLGPFPRRDAVLPLADRGLDRRAGERDDEWTVHVVVRCGCACVARAVVASSRWAWNGPRMATQCRRYPDRSLPLPVLLGRLQGLHLQCLAAMTRLNST